MYIPLQSQFHRSQQHEQHYYNVRRQRSASSVRSGIDPAMFPVATFEARKEAGQLADAFATDLNKKAGREVAAAKVTILKSITRFPLNYVLLKVTAQSLRVLPQLLLSITTGTMAALAAKGYKSLYHAV